LGWPNTLKTLARPRRFERPTSAFGAKVRRLASIIKAEKHCAKRSDHPGDAAYNTRCQQNQCFNEDGDEGPRKARYAKLVARTAQKYEQIARSRGALIASSSCRCSEVSLLQPITLGHCHAIAHEDAQTDPEFGRRAFDVDLETRITRVHRHREGPFFGTIWCNSSSRFCSSKNNESVTPVEQRTAPVRLFNDKVLMN
jgi:hypothetical protein